MKNSINNSEFSINGFGSYRITGAETVVNSCLIFDNSSDEDESFEASDSEEIWNKK